ncbi:hypothetical protein J0676_01010 [Vibrio sp. Vb2880]|uniref:3-demethylubiquinone-9 3-methyltransferase n=1 Tax=Vibrio furnissii TaxID=29494 RepID=A0A0Q2QWD8_VIBFU|nr:MULTISPECIES: hypothetical protein [Vibrio]ADT86907.1 hypothetical protein vfu_A01743 [Vibrio furnissii NCTC 11218]EEX41501.1 hypothetical protein VFA_001335 [Vibrio furnissii CIP 102972]KQH84349.1 3-demethylubiquinone-9 3-methyltransferase [Vibrio furnissii]MBO0212068.1 hypothetical protein [Vibrio sp. Vb2880]MCG6212327.1 hypothetical protein [Vibrio furnissii]
MDYSVITQLKKDFYAQISALQSCTLPQSKPTLSILTPEELKELEQLWVELAVWKKTQSH